MPYAAINVEGGLFPTELLDDIASGEASLPATSALGGDTRRLTDDVQSAFSAARSYWDAFQHRLDHSNESRTTLTRQDWMLKFLEQIGFGSLSFQRASLDAGDQQYNISHLASEYEDAPPVHIVGIDQELDLRDETGRRISPHALVQEYLNRSNALWGLVGNGSVLRLLRDTARLSKPTYLEFNLQAMMEGNQYSEFALLYRLIHSSHFPHPEGNAQECGLEKYYQDGLDQGGRVRENLRNGVEEALRTLGTAFLQHPDSDSLRQKFQSGDLDAPGYYRQLLRLVYRFLFLMVAEERHLIFPEDSAATAEQTIYRDYYSISKLRDRSEKYFRGDRHSDLWQGLGETFRLFRDTDSAAALKLSALNGELFGPKGCPDLEEANCRNEDLLYAVLRLSTFFDDKAKLRRRVNYTGLDVEELGSVYESLLDFRPQVSVQNQAFDLVIGSERKETGSYYTPSQLVRELINSALVPVMEERLTTTDDKEAALLGFRVCDPASGSGHFLLAAARQIARELARIRSDNQEPSPGEYRLALRDVMRSCIYAVDKNPLAVDLCKVALWIEGHSSGLPLSFLDHHIKCGDSLVGVADLSVLDDGIPDGAYKPVTGDDKGAAKVLTQKNKQERRKDGGVQLALGSAGAAGDIGERLAGEFGALGQLEEDTPADVGVKEEMYLDLRGESTNWWKMKVACDLWASAFFLPLEQGDAPGTEKVPTTGTLKRYLEADAAYGPLAVASVEASDRHGFFHWPLEFPDVMESGGFDVVLGNPPWERIKLQEQEFFASREPVIADAPNKAARTRLIAELGVSNPGLAHEFEQAKHSAEAQSRFVRGSGRFPLSAFGDVNTYALFAERFRTLCAPAGRAGVIVPTGIATDDSTKTFFGDLVEHGSLVSLYDFENREAIFAGVHRSYKFSLLTLAGAGIRSQNAEFAFFLHRTEQLADVEKRFTLSGRDFQLMNPNTRTCPVFRTKRDADITRGIYERILVLVDENKGDEGNPWGINFQRMFDMSNDSGLFRNKEELEVDGWTLDGNIFNRGPDKYLPLYEAKLFHQFDHRWATYDGADSRDARDDEKAQPDWTVLPRYWVPEQDVNEALGPQVNQSFLLGFRDIARSTDRRTFIASLIPPVAVGNSCPLVLLDEASHHLVGCLMANLNAVALDFVARQKVGGTHLNFFIVNQLPVLPPSAFEEAAPWTGGMPVSDWMRPRILELVYTSSEMQAVADELGYQVDPFEWDTKRRLELRCELDAAFFHLYGLTLDEVDYVMETFPIVKREDEAAFGEYRTKGLVLDYYNQLSAIKTG